MSDITALAHRLIDGTATDVDLKEAAIALEDQARIITDLRAEVKGAVLEAAAVRERAVLGDPTALVTEWVTEWAANMQPILQRFTVPR